MQVIISQDPQGTYLAQFKGEFVLRSGQTLIDIVCAYETYGKRSKNDNNVIVIHHSLAPSAHVAAHAKNPKPGWWDALVGPAKAIDTNHYFVICINNLGSCYGSTGPASINPDTGNPYRNTFPRITIEDMVRAQKMLLDALGIASIHAAIGGSMGGMLTLAWGVLYPQHARYLVPISTAYKAYPLQRAHRTCQREAIALDPNWQHGAYSHNPVAGLKLARMISHLFYRGLAEVDVRFLAQDDKSDGEESVLSYYHYNSNKFAQQFDSCTYMALLDAMDDFDLTAENPLPCVGLEAKVLVVSTDTDVLYPARQQEDIVALLRDCGVDVRYIAHQSQFGHDAFLVEANRMGQYIKEFII